MGWRWAEGQGAWLFSGCSCPEAGVDPSLCGSPSLPCPLRCCLPDLGQPGEGPRGLPIYTGGLTAPDTAPSLRRWPSGPSTTVSALQTPGRGARAPRGLWAAGGTGTWPADPRDPLLTPRRRRGPMRGPAADAPVRQPVLRARHVHRRPGRLPLRLRAGLGGPLLPSR